MISEFFGAQSLSSQPANELTPTSKNWTFSEYSNGSYNSGIPATAPAVQTSAHDVHPIFSGSRERIMIRPKISDNTCEAEGLTTAGIDFISRVTCL